MKTNDKRKIVNRNSAIKTIIGITLAVIVLWYIGIEINFLILGLLILSLGVLTYYALDHDDDIEDIKNTIEEIKNSRK